ncbi:hypothetical protein NG798_23275 [Ancylothrix sp. C2]|uniref:hypothetical protein n=1 Tax=Ancylothrix sp. D3o TaxID=2953691 RepID=UPI0021BA801B|nr:hypothetical protein [Ancylothrix sp. D3o]MCT7952726.1 hypothetical protein [Ancylothrix sp. D3o]
MLYQALRTVVTPSDPTAVRLGCLCGHLVHVYFGMWNTLSGRCPPGMPVIYILSVRISNGYKIKHFARVTPAFREFRRPLTDPPTVAISPAS